MTDHSHAHHDLTRNQTLVMDALTGETGPLSAYTILDRLRDHGFRAPLQVYRALEKLVDMGLVHRLESLNAFVACRHPGCVGHSSIAFTICERCGAVAEITDAELAAQLRHLTASAGFVLKKSVVELRGVCVACAA